MRILIVLVTCEYIGFVRIMMRIDFYFYRCCCFMFSIEFERKQKSKRAVRVRACGQKRMKEY